jgi:hypothetical protein
VRAGRRPRVALVALVASMGAAAVVSRPRDAHAQLRWDAGVQAGVTKRFTSGGDAAAPAPGFGPTFGVQGHVALVPMVRLGLYLDGELSPASPESPRTFWAGGLHTRITPPLLGGAWRLWLYAGAGYAYTYSVELHAPGGMVDLPVGLGVGRKINGTWLVYAELGTRFGLGFQGSMYARPSAAAPSASPFLGQDSFALSASVGISLEQ